MPVGQPAQQRRHIAAVGPRVTPVRVGLHVVGQVVEDGPHRGRVRRDPTHIGEHAWQQPFGFVQRLGLDRGRKLYVHPGLFDTAVRCVLSGLGLDAQQISVWVAADLEHRVHDRRVRHTKPVQQHRHRIHQHRAVVGDQLQRGAEPARIVRRIDGDSAFSGRPVQTKAVVRGKQCRRHRRGSSGANARPAVVRRACRRAGLDSCLRRPWRSSRECPAG